MFRSYDDIFGAYVEELAAARDDAMAWWAALKQAAGSTPESDPDEAKVRPRWPGGPNSHPRVLGVYHRFYLETVDYNERAMKAAQQRDEKRDEEPADERWGTAEPPEPPEDYELTPEDLLLERLEYDAPDLDAFMMEMLVYPAAAPLRNYPEAVLPELGAAPARFEFATIHRVPQGIQRLMSAPRDLPPSAPWHDPPLSLGRASAVHRTLFLEYCRELQAGLRIAEQWWKGVVKQSSPGLFSRKKSAVNAAYERYFAGPANHVVILGLLHDYWMKCVESNAAVAEPERVPPEVVLLHWLLDGRHESWVQCLTCLPYWPIGLDAAGNWI